MEASIYPEKPLEAMFSRELLNQMEVTIDDDEARNQCYSEWAATPFRS